MFNDLNPAKTVGLDHGPYDGYIFHWPLGRRDGESTNLSTSCLDLLRRNIPPISTETSLPYRLSHTSCLRSSASSRPRPFFAWGSRPLQSFRTSPSFGSVDDGWARTDTFSHRSFARADSSPGLTKRNPPTFGGDFSPGHLTELAQVRVAFVDAIGLADKVLRTNAVDGPIFKRYFKDSDKAAVKGVFQAIYGDGSTLGNKDFPKLSIWFNEVAGSTKTCQKTWLGKQVIAYLAHETNGDGAQVVVCPVGYKYPRLQDIDCGKLGDAVSGEMSSLGGVLLHEFT